MRRSIFVLLPFVFILFIGFLALADKYNGGSYDGFSMSTSAEDQSLDQISSDKYHGGSYDGFCMVTSAYDLPLDLILMSKYYGGSYDGFDIQTSAFDQPLDKILMSKYYGGSYDGCDLAESAIDISLPVSLLIFKATTEDQHIILSWITFSEINNDVFLLERGRDVDSLFIIAIIAGQGNSNSNHVYEYIDNKVRMDITYYYRLSSRDFNGKVTHHQKVSVILKKPKPKKFVLYSNFPNPFNPSTTIEFDLPKTTQVTLRIFNILGEEVATLVSDILSAGSYSYDWNASNLASGIYMYILEAGEFIKTKKMILMR